MNGIGWTRLAGRPEFDVLVLRVFGFLRLLEELVDGVGSAVRCEVDGLGRLAVPTMVISMP